MGLVPRLREDVFFGSQTWLSDPSPAGALKKISVRGDCGNWELRSVKRTAMEKWRRESSVNVKNAHQQSQTVPESVVVPVDDTVPVQRHQESGQLDRDECVESEIGSLFAGRQMATPLQSGRRRSTSDHGTRYPSERDSSKQPLYPTVASPQLQEDATPAPCRTTKLVRCTSQLRASTIQRCTLRHTEK